MMSSASSEFYFFLSNVDDFSFFCLLPLSRTHNIMLNKSGKSRHPCAVPDVRGKTFSLSPLSLMLAMACHIWPL